VGVDEWVTFTVETQLYVEQYRETEGEKRYYLGDLVGEKTLKFYVTSRSKIDYVGDVLDAVDWDITRAKAAIAEVEGQLGESLGIDLGSFEAMQTAMETAIEEGDYVTAIALYEGFEPTWRDDLEEKLVAEAEEKKALVSALEDARDQLEGLTRSFQTIEASLANVTASYRLEVQELEDSLAAAKTNGRLYLFGIVIALVGLVLVFLRSLRNKSTPVA
jgi:DNA repair exonuclease SbcCD ATPase subunit